MSFNNNNNKSNDVIDYLIKKLESRLKGINKKKDIFNNITNIENFYLNKNIFLKLFSELFEDIQQAIYAIKTLYLENKILNQENINNKQYLNEVKNKKDYFNNISTNKNNFLDSNNNYYFNYNLTDDSNNNNNFNKLENAEEIMKNIQENKQLLKDKINKHFNNFNYENNFNNNNFNENNKNNNNKNFNFSNNLNNNNNFMQNIKRYLPNYKKPQKKKSNSQRKNSKIPLRIGIQTLNNSKNKTNKKLNKSFESTNFYRNSGKILPAFEFSLRNYPNQSKSITKQFNNYTNPYGNYFSSFDYLN